MGFVAPISRWTANSPEPSADDVRVVRCNNQAVQPDFATVIAELSEHRPDIVAFQEVRGDDHPLMAKYFAGWHVVRDDNYWIGSKYPVRMIQPITTKTFDRVAGLVAEVDLPSGTILVANVHQMTARRSLSELSPRAILNGYGPDIIMPHQVQREEEIMEIRLAIDDRRGGLPVLVLGDFNMPSSSSLFRRWWGEYTNAFDAAGLGFGYTSPCRKNQRHWFDDTPWVRIDHILCSPEWSVVSCDVGEQNGSDHRLIAARLHLP
jgi:endonuclease/exonuclease/phosphatase (EEP) superfamily protein YafD